MRRVPSSFVACSGGRAAPRSPVFERAIVCALNGLRAARDRRQTVRELRRLSPALLADIGMEPEEIERMVDARLAGRRYLTAMRISP